MKLTIIGTRYVGFVTGTCISERRNKVYCVDIDEDKINSLKGNMPIYEPHLRAVVLNNQKRVILNKVVNRFGEDLSGLYFSFRSLALKPCTDDVRASSLMIISELIKKGAKDTFKFTISKMNEDYFNCIEFCDYKYDAVNDCDALILITEWREFRNPDFEEISKRLNKSIIFDGRNIYNNNLEGFELYQIEC